MADEPTSKKPVIAMRLFQLFSGLGRAHGKFTLSGKVKGKKVEGKAALVKEPLTVKAWEEHLAGEAGLGVIPIRDDATCRFGAIDIDVYEGMNLSEIVKQVQGLKLPLVVCRSKSGGAHLYLFGKEDLPAALLRTKLMEMAVVLGYAGVEVFPKQASLASDKDFGNWINMPYFNDKVTLRYAIGEKGGQLSVIQFLDLAERAQVTSVELEQLTPNAEDHFPDGPPCLQALAIRGFPNSSTHNALYNMGVYLHKKHGDAGWDQELEELNRKFIPAPFGHKEVAALMKSVLKKNYEYKCKEAPICFACNREICLTRKHGIRGAKNDPGVTFGELIKVTTEPPVYLWDVNGERLELISVQIMDQKKFHQVAFERLDIWPTIIRGDLWQQLVKERLEKVEYLEAPAEASRKGHVWTLVEEFCTSRAHGLSRDELLMKKPWTEAGWTYFRSTDLQVFLVHQGVKQLTEYDLWSMLRNHGAKHGRWNVKGKTVQWWAVPEFAQASGLDVPFVKESGI